MNNRLIVTTKYRLFYYSLNDGDRLRIDIQLFYKYESDKYYIIIRR